MTKAKWLGTLAIMLLAFLGALIWERSTEPPQEAIPAPAVAEEDTLHVVTLEAITFPQEPVTEPVSPFSSDDVTRHAVDFLLLSFSIRSFCSFLEI